MRICECLEPQPIGHDGSETPVCARCGEWWTPQHGSIENTLPRNPISMTKRYTIECWSNGWLLCAPEGSPGLPMQALSETCRLFPKDAVMDLGIPHHYRETGRPEVAFCIGQPKALVQWRGEIVESLSKREPQARWWLGCDVGQSSAAIFAVICDASFATKAREYARGSAPRDAADFARCVNLLSLFPQWRMRLAEVATAYPDSKWPALVQVWAQLEACAPEEINRRLLSL